MDYNLLYPFFITTPSNPYIPTAFFIMFKRVREAKDPFHFSLKSKCILLQQDVSLFSYHIDVLTKIQGTLGSL